MTVLYFVLLLVAVLLFLLASLRVSSPRVELVALGLAFAFAVPLLQQLQRL